MRKYTIIELADHINTLQSWWWTTDGEQHFTATCKLTDCDYVCQYKVRYPYRKDILERDIWVDLDYHIIAKDDILFLSNEDNLKATLEDAWKHHKLGCRYTVDSVERCRAMIQLIIDEANKRNCWSE